MKFRKWQGVSWKDIRGKLSGGKAKSGIDPLDFSPGLLRIQAQPPAPFARTLLHILLTLLALLILWSALSHLDIVATAEGKLIPQSYLKIVQPSDQGQVRDILVEEGEIVSGGQVLMRLDPTLSDADGKALQSDYQGKQLDLRRIDAELADRPFTRVDGDPEDQYRETEALYRANRMAYMSALSEERSVKDKAQNDLAAAEETRTKLVQTLPHFRKQDEAYAELANEGYVSQMEAADKAREHIEKEQDLKTQDFLIASARATLEQSAKRLAQITFDYRQKLEAERADVSDRMDKSEAEYTKQQYRHALLELKAPDGCGKAPAKDVQASGGCIVKDLATHTVGTVISPGTILMTLVPKDEVLRAEVWVSNQDVGFIHPGEPVKLKLASYTFQKYGMIDGEVGELGADATDNSQQGQGPQAAGKPGASQPYTYRALIDLKAQKLVADGIDHALTPGMQVTAEINLGTRTILEYLLSPVAGAFQEAARER